MTEQSREDLLELISSLRKVNERHADLAKAQVAAALREAADKAGEAAVKRLRTAVLNPGPLREQMTRQNARLPILALIDQPAQAALDRVVAEAERRGMRQAGVAVAQATAETTSPSAERGVEDAFFDGFFTAATRARVAIAKAIQETESDD